jgi:hypothetical protein
MPILAGGEPAHAPSAHLCYVTLLRAPKTFAHNRSSWHAA